MLYWKYIHRDCLQVPCNEKNDSKVTDNFRTENTRKLIN